MDGLPQVALRGDGATAAMHDEDALEVDRIRRLVFV
jgi:hypothetical protein